MNPDPRSTYSRLLAERQAEIASRERKHRALGYWRLAAVACGAVIVGMALFQRFVSILWAAIPLVVFIFLAVRHERLLRVLERRRRAARFFERGLARLDGRWAGTGEPGDRYLDPAHPYARDLDLFGKGSLFELISTARTHIGEDTLPPRVASPARALPLFGKGSLFELISPARTHMGEDPRAHWLLSPADPATVRARQEA